MILNIDTTTNICSVALSNDGVIIDVIETDKEMSHSSMLSVFIEDILKKNSLKPQDLSAIAVSGGPGSYTGLRIGTSTAKGLCFGLEIPLIAVSTLESMAYSTIKEFGIKKALVLPMIDARRMEVYTLAMDCECNIVKDVYSLVVEQNSFEDLLEKYDEIYICGNGADKCKTIINDARVKYIENRITSAKSMVELSYKRFINNQYEDLAYYEPFYLKAFVAIKSKQLL